MKFAFIAEEKVAFPVAALCRVLEVSEQRLLRVAGSSRVSTRARRDEELVASGASGPRGQQGTLRQPARPRRASGERGEVGRKRVARLMRDAQPGCERSAAASVRRRTPSTLSRSRRMSWRGTSPRRRRIKPGSPTSPSIWTREGWLYLAVILDLFSRRVVGWATSENIDRHLALAALGKALRDTPATRGLVHHSDRGSTYASGDYRRPSTTTGIECSMSRKGDCWDNAVAESFFASLKREVEEIDELESRAQGTAVVGEYIDGSTTCSGATRPSAIAAPLNLN